MYERSEANELHQCLNLFDHDPRRQEDLQKQLGELELPKSGKKAALVERLVRVRHLGQDFSCS